MAAAQIHAAKMRNSPEDQALWKRHASEWRDPAQIASQWKEASAIDPRMLETRSRGQWWELLERLGVTLFVTREYEHLTLALSAREGRPRVTFFPVPHPSGLVVDRTAHRLYLASTRNPNQVHVLKPTTGLLERTDTKAQADCGHPFAPVTSTCYPGCLYMHDLALIGGELYSNAVGHNAVVRLNLEGGFRRVWWPKCIEHDGKPVFERNHIQLNSIAAGRTPRDSFYSASSCSLGRLRPGHLSYKVDRQGVVFSGRTREPVCHGLTRPHSARLRKGRIWVANSGYGELGFVTDGRLEVVCKLPGWTRGLCLIDDIAFVGTSRVIPRFSRYAPGLDRISSICGVHAVHLKNGSILGSIEWPAGNQVFAMDWISDRVSPGFLFRAERRRSSQEIAFFYRYLTN
jgi:uncharacterized protein (TIGR03032 family)